MVLRCVILSSMTTERGWGELLVTLQRRMPPHSPQRPRRDASHKTLVMGRCQRTSRPSSVWPRGPNRLVGGRGE